ncbi:MAG: phosphoglucomutase/phosphomannomutase family protein [bacterium]|jgi:phosphomannomutase|nr:phosphoglucomutase/phosphomannomutase family protein [bacterium]MDD3804711.1 phosphoglucomutase/phosphomannomutase family protein [bacterium]
MKGIEFGIDGWMAVIADKFTFDNVRLAAQGIAEYLKERVEEEIKIAVGYDTRFLSDNFAEAVSEVLAANDIRVNHYYTACPSPLISYLVKSDQLSGGVVVTGSHKPPRFNGIKFKASYGGPASTDMARRIGEKIAVLGDKDIKRTPIVEAIESGKVVIENGDKEYLNHLLSLVNTDAIKSFAPAIVADPMHGAGIGYLSDLLNRAGCMVYNIREDLNPIFAGVNPEPIARNLEELSQEMKKSEAAAGFAVDGDADHLGVMNSWGGYISPQQVFPLLLLHLIRNKNWNGIVVKTAAVTSMIDKIANMLNLRVRETPAGFQNIAALMLEEDFLIGGEESGGYSFKNHIPERDGLLSALMLTEMMAMEHRTIAELLNSLYDEFGALYYYERSLHVQTRDTLIDDLKARAPGVIAGVKVSDIRMEDGIKYIMRNGNWLLIRASATEPIVKVYAEAGDITEAQELLDAGGEMIGAEATIEPIALEI